MPSDVEPVDQDLTAGGQQVSGDHSEGGRLAGAVGTQKSHDFSGRDLEIDRIYGLESAESL